MRSLPALTLAAAVATLGGCAVGPNYTRPEVALTQEFSASRAVDTRVAAAAPDLARWWDGFHDPVLSDLVARALGSNLDLEQAVARVRQARASLRSADAALLPSANLNASAAVAHNSLETPLGRVLTTIPGVDRDAELYQADVGASWEVDIFGGLRRDREAARAEYQASAAGVVAARVSVAAQVADTYVVIRGLQARIAIARQQLDTQRRLLSTVRLQYEKGVAAELQVRQAEGVLSQVQSSVPILEAGLIGALNSMDVLLGAQPGTYRAQLEQGGSVPSAPSIASAGGPAELLRRRPDLIIAERRLAASNARIGSAISEYFPKFSLSGLLGTATTASGGLFGGGANQAQGVFGLRWRLFDFGRVDAEISSARGRNAELLAAYRQTVLRATEDVEDSFVNLVKREDQERSLAQGETSLTRARDASLAAYKGGVVSLIEVLDADTRLLSTRDQRATARTEAARAAIASFRSLGGGWSAPDLAATAAQPSAS